MLHLITKLHHIKTTLSNYIMTTINVLIRKVYHNLLLTSCDVKCEALIPCRLLSSLSLRSLRLLTLNYNKYIGFDWRTTDTLSHPEVLSFYNLYCELAIFHDSISVKDLFCAGDLKLRLKILNNLLPSLNL